MEMKSKKTALFIIMVLVSVVIISGCAQQPAGNETVSDVKSDKDVAQVVGDVSTDISDFSKELENIDKGLG